MTGAREPLAHLEASETAAVRDLREGYRRYRPSVITLVLGAAILASLVFLYVNALTMPHGAPLAAAWFGGTFVGGAATGRLPNAGWVGLAGLVFGLLTLHFSGPLSGHVGVLGATATIAGLAVGALEWVVLAPAVQRQGVRLRARVSGGSG